MKKFFVMIGVVAAIITLANCNPAKKTTASASVAKTTYAANVSTVIQNRCTPCHIPAKGGNKKAYVTYAAAKGDIDEMIRRIELNPGEKGYMPFKHPKLNDSTIAVFKKWKADGLLEN